MRLLLACALLLILVLPASAQVSGRAFAGFAGSSSGGPINIEADDLRIDEAKGRAVYEGNVVVRRGASTVRTGILTIEFQPGGGLGQDAIDRLRFARGLEVTNADNTVVADGGVFNVRTDDIVLTGRVFVSQGESVAKGCKLIANLKTNRAKLEGCPEKGRKKGRVKTVFTPGAATN